MNALADIHKLLDSVSSELPDYPRIVKIELEDGFDYTGDPSLFIWVIMDDDFTDDDETWENVRKIERVFRDTLRTTGDERWPYLRFRTESEHRELTAG